MKYRIPDPMIAWSEEAGMFIARSGFWSLRGISAQGATVQEVRENWDRAMGALIQQMLHDADDYSAVQADLAITEDAVPPEVFLREYVGLTDRECKNLVRLNCPEYEPTIGRPSAAVAGLRFTYVGGGYYDVTEEATGKLVRRGLRFADLLSMATEGTPGASGGTD